MVSDPASGANTRESFASYDPATSSWRTSQLCVFEGSESFSDTLPPSGTMRSGHLYRRALWAPHIHGIGCSLWPTPRARDCIPEGYEAGKQRETPNLPTVLQERWGRGPVNP